MRIRYTTATSAWGARSLDEVGLAARRACTALFDRTPVVQGHSAASSGIILVPMMFAAILTICVRRATRFEPLPLKVH